MRGLIRNVGERPPRVSRRRWDGRIQHERKTVKSKQSRAADEAWRTMRGAPWKARRSERLSKEALEEWATRFGFRIAFLDAVSGRPGTGIADALVFRITPRAADQIELYVVQLKGGKSGFKAAEMARLTSAASNVKVTPLVILHDGKQLHFLGGEPSFTRLGREGRGKPKMKNNG